LDLQGVAALLAMNILAEVEGLDRQPWGCADHLHAAIEAMRLAFGDALQYNADPDVVPVPIERLVSAEHAKLRRAQIQPDKVSAWATLHASAKCAKFRKP
jgi:gamma-glutamyltranspeptidase/glutathione hydrolase